jgi:glutathione S-transferase
MRLYSFAYSPFVAKVKKCLELKGITFEVVEVPYLDRRELVAKTGGYVHVPVLEDQGEIVTESARISAYLDSHYPLSLREDPLAVVFEQWAEGPLEDAAFRVAAPGMYDRFAELQGGREDAREIWRLMKERRYGDGCVEAWRKNAAALTKTVGELFAPIALAVKVKPFVLGATPSLADAAIYGQLFMLESAKSGWIAAHLPSLAAYFERVAGARGGQIA